MSLSIDLITTITCLIIIAAFVWSVLYVMRTDPSEIQKRRKWMSQLPSLISTLGVLGTFFGITRGLLAFNTEDLDRSIPILLEGLKTAFFTSLIGMLGSIILNRLVTSKLQEVNTESEAEVAASKIIDAINNAQSAMFEKLQSELPIYTEDEKRYLQVAVTRNPELSAIREDIIQIKDDIEELKAISGESRERVSELCGSNDDIKNAVQPLSEELERLQAVILTATSSISAIDNYTDQISTTQSEINESGKNALPRIIDILSQLSTDISSLEESAADIFDLADRIYDNTKN